MYNTYWHVTTRSPIALPEYRNPRTGQFLFQPGPDAHPSGSVGQTSQYGEPLLARGNTNGDGDKRDAETSQGNGPGTSRVCAGAARVAVGCLFCMTEIAWQILGYLAIQHSAIEGVRYAVVGLLSEHERATAHGVQSTIAKLVSSR